MDLAPTIDAAWEKRSEISSKTEGSVRDAVNAALAGLDDGSLRIAEKINGAWQVHQWLKKAVLLSFRLKDSYYMKGPEGSGWWDKVPSKFMGWTSERFTKAGFRAVPNCTVRYSAFIAPNAIIMPSFINVGARIGEGTMIDGFAHIGSCAQIGNHCHISATVMIGGVLEPLQANPVIIEDNCFIGACSGVAEGIIIEEGAVLGMGVMIGASTKIVDRSTGHIIYGKVPAYSVIVPGVLPGTTLPDGTPGPLLACAVIVKRVDEQTRAKTSVNDLLRD